VKRPVGDPANDRSPPSPNPGRVSAARPVRRPSIGGVLLAAIAATLLVPVPAAADWFVVCDAATGAVVLDEAGAREGRERLAGPFPGPRSAETWVVESCSSLRCARGKGCVAAAAEGSGGWVAGEVTSVTLSGEGGAGAAPAAGGSTPVGPAAPDSGELAPFVETAKAAAAGCSFESALMVAEQMTRFDPNDPWLVANLPKLKRLAERQRTTEATVWQASAALSSGDLKRARKLAGTAADNAVSCQSQAVGELVRGIDAAIAADREARSADNRRAAAALLPGLVDLSRALSGVAGVPASARGVAVLPPSVGGGTRSAPGAPDPCAFQYAYKTALSVEPICTCPGYRFDARQLRCVR
jgi:hypothetical protein